MFQPAGKVKKSLKIAVYGEPGTGKTWFGLMANGKKAVVDTENGTDFYWKRFKFDVVKTRLYSEVMKALDHIEKNPGKYDVLMIDPITNIYQTLKDAGQLSAERRAQKYKRDPEEATLTFRDWGIIKNKYNSLISRLCNLPCHVILTGWLKDVYEEHGNEIKRVGSRIDADKKTEYQPDVIIRLELDNNGNRFGVIEKDRTMTYKPGQRVRDISFNDFLDAANTDGEESRLQLDDEAAEAEAKAFAETIEEIKTAWVERGLKEQALNLQLRKLYNVGLYDLTEQQGQDFLDKLQGKEESKEQQAPQNVPNEASTITDRQLKAIHAASADKGLTEEERRAVISYVSKNRTNSSKGLTSDEAREVISTINLNSREMMQGLVEITKPSEDNEEQRLERFKRSMADWKEQVDQMHA